jgi:hypothetical protein
VNTTLFPIRHPRFRLDVPSTWPKLDIGVHFAQYTVDEDVTLNVRWMTHLVLDEGAWIESVMREGLAAPKLTRLAFEPALSDKGWPMVFAAYNVSDGKVVEHRVGAFYRIVHTQGEAVFHLRNGVRWEDRAATLRPLLLAGHVDWPIYQEQDLLYPLLGMRA